MTDVAPTALGPPTLSIDMNPGEAGTTTHLVTEELREATGMIGAALGLLRPILTAMFLDRKPLQLNLLWRTLSKTP